MEEKSIIYIAEGRDIEVQYTFKPQYERLPELGDASDHRARESEIADIVSE